jgi:hypothetical protein
MEPTEKDWRRVGQAIEARMAELVIGPGEIKNRKGPSDKPLKGYIAGGRIVRLEVRRRLCRALEWTDDSIDRILRNEEPVPVPRVTPSAETVQMIEEAASLMSDLARRAREGRF